MNTRLLSLRVADAGGVEAEFSVEGRPAPVVTTFTVDDGDLAVASASPDVLRDFRGTAEELRGIVATVLSFSRAARGFVEGFILAAEGTQIDRAQVEHPALVANPNVTSITAVNPATGSSTVLWRRP